MSKSVLGKGQTPMTTATTALDIGTFLTTLYVLIDDFCRHHWEPEIVHRGPMARFSRSETLTRPLFGQLSRFERERDFYREVPRDRYS